ncbi:FRG domain-containing protein [Azospirillum argentinense]|uniref:FRG domain-containing protein n=1 Tax=Azospirillum argentinense TaxID=2970906 RepID=UPI00190EBDC4|nr:FRG domain-containing protein [Azospirillum argentinense]
MEEPQDADDSTVNIDDETITSINDYLHWVKRITKSFGLRRSTITPWYRGHPVHDWKLKPSLYRSEVPKICEREMLRDFKLYATEFLGQGQRSDIDWLFIAQHHGIPTRLLDWTENPLVALFFVVHDYGNKADGRVWAINPWELNTTSIGLQSVPHTDNPIFMDYVVDITDPEFPREVKAKRPIAIRPYHVFRRSNAQSGVFTVHGTIEKALESTQFTRKNRKACLRSAKINGESKITIMRDLHALGIHHASLFQSVDHIAATLRMRYSWSFLKD